MPMSKQYVYIYGVSLIFCSILLLVESQDCSGTQFRCASGTCLGQSNVCDGVNDCPDGSDEARNLCVQNGTCIKSGMFLCNQSPNGSPPFCIRNSSVCNGIWDCVTGEDESTARCKGGCGSDTFQCTDTLCIAAEHVCDGVSDCPSGLDEANCTAPTCPPNAFYCSYGTCISNELICNGYWDCRDGSDEDPSYCNPNTTCEPGQIYCSAKKPGQECLDISGFCSGLLECTSIPYTRIDCGVDMCTRDQPCGAGSYCRNLALGYECYCNAGYRLSSDRISCTDVDECTETPQVCSQFCANTPGSYSCSCQAGFTPTQDPGVCQRINNSITPVLLFGHRYYISSMNIDGSGYKPFALNLTFAHVLDFDWQTQALYHFDVTLKSLHVMDISGKNDVTVDRLHSTSVEGIAIDWIHRKIFWTSTQLMGIYIAELDGTHTTPVVKGVSPNCRGIAVHPQYRFILWTDWGWQPFIARIGMDGSTMTKLITTDIFWPNGLTLDYVINRFWWVDALLDRISYASLDGSNRHVLISKSLSHTYGITQFDSSIFWTDWNYKSVNTSNRLTGMYQKPLLSNLPIQPYDIKVFHPDRQPALPEVDPCANNNGGCSHMCMPSPTLTEGYMCTCPQEKPLLADGKTCNITCSVSEMTCNDGMCIPWYYQCNGRPECRYGEDEPELCPNRTCASNLFECGEDQGLILCISVTQVCNGVPECADMSDEDVTMCSNRECQVWEFLCPSTGRCIPLSWACDQRRDCALGEDEAPYNPQCDINQCKSNEFRCNNTICIPQLYYCDVDDDCGDRSDEPADCWIYRNSHPCPAGYKRCPKNYRCIPINSFCDGMNDCRDGSDELPENCVPCNLGEFTCANEHCIPLRWLCDFNDDCGDNSDEDVTMCKSLYRNCTDVEFRCSDNRCLHEHLRCDGNKDCSDGSDELNCGLGCAAGYSKCGSGECITATRICNGNRDCADGSDELACPTRYPGGKYCTDDQFTCNNTICLGMMSVCDTFDNCGDGSDESTAACNSVKCPLDMFQCPTLRNCISKQYVCDGIPQCEFGADEQNCQNCEADHLFQCNSTGSCIDESLKCDLKYDCVDGSDEKGCPQSSCTQCQQNCTVINMNTQQVVCSCWNGYLINPKDTRTCVERNDCESLAYNWCPHTCVSEKKAFLNITYKCLCAEGFNDLNGDGRTCVPLDGFRGGLLYGLGNRLVLQNFTSNEIVEINELSLNTNPGGDITAVDTDARKRIAYWIDDVTIFRAAIPESHNQMAYEQKVLTTSLATGLSYDWIAGNIYWCDKDGIYVTSENVYWMKTTLFKNASLAFKPSRILVNPSEGQLFFINDYYLKPEILTMDMTGANMRSIVAQNLIYPSDLAIDLSLGNRLFWTDGGQNIIESCLSDGSDRTIHVNDDKHPWRLDIFAGKLYWTTTERDQMRMADSLGQGVRTVFLSQQMDIGPVKYVQPLKYNQYTNNLCDGYGCTFCLLGPTLPKCVCPDGVFFKRGSVSECDITPPAGYVPLGEPKLCSCVNQGVCEVQNGSPRCVCPRGFTGEQCELLVVSVTPTIGSSSGPSIKQTPTVSSTSIKSTPPSPVVSDQSSSNSPSSTTTPPRSSNTTSTTTEILPAGSKSGSDNRALKIALPVVLLSVLLILIIIALLCACRRRRKHSDTYGRHFDDSSSISSVPNSPTSPREPVAFQAGIVQFGHDNLEYSNPMYKDKDMAVVLDPPPYSPPYDSKDGLEKRDPGVSDGYNQLGKDSSLNAGYDQMKPLEFTTLPMSHHSNA